MRPARDFILFAQHGWADTNRRVSAMANTLATPKTLVITPNLGWIKTWLWIDPLVVEVEQIAGRAISENPNTPLRIIGHSMGGSIWLEVLSRHQEWWPQVHSLVLVASPVGGSHLARIFDPFGFGVGIAKDLGINRRAMAEAIAAVVPTLTIAGDIGNGSDGTVPVGATKFSNARFTCLPGLRHASMKNHARVINSIRDFWANPQISIPASASDFSDRLIRYLRAVPGMTDGELRNFSQAKAIETFPDGTTLRIWRHPLQLYGVFVGDRQGNCLYGGYVGWPHVPALQAALEGLPQKLNSPPNR